MGTRKNKGDMGEGVTVSSDLAEGLVISEVGRRVGVRHRHDVLDELEIYNLASARKTTTQAAPASGCGFDRCSQGAYPVAKGWEIIERGNGRNERRRGMGKRCPRSHTGFIREGSIC